MAVGEDRQAGVGPGQRLVDASRSAEGVNDFEVVGRRPDLVAQDLDEPVGVVGGDGVGDPGLGGTRNALP